MLMAIAAPVYCDNAGNLNYRAVKDVLEQQIVIPINIPCYTVIYDGAIEHSEGELKGWARWKASAKTIRELALLVENTAHILNHNLLSTPHLPESS
jgi:hypothetical protein